MGGQPVPLVDLGCMPGTCLPYGTQFFHFRMYLHQKAPASDIHAPLMGSHPPMGNPGSASVYCIAVALKTVLIKVGMPSTARLKTFVDK